MLMDIAFVITLSILGQLYMTVTFLKEAITTTEGTYCRVKCFTAGFIYLIFALMLTWFVFF